MSEKIIGVDMASLELFNWFTDNCSEKEKDMIYIACNFSKAYLIENDISSASQCDLDMLNKVKVIIEKYDMPDLNLRNEHIVYEKIKGD